MSNFFAYLVVLLHQDLSGVRKDTGINKISEKDLPEKAKGAYYSVLKGVEINLLNSRSREGRMSELY